MILYLERRRRRLFSETDRSSKQSQIQKDDITIGVVARVHTRRDAMLRRSRNNPNRLSKERRMTGTCKDTSPRRRDTLRVLDTRPTLPLARLLLFPRVKVVQHGAFLSFPPFLPSPSLPLSVGAYK